MANLEVFKRLDLQEALLVPAVCVESNKPYLPLPNRVETVLGESPPPSHLTRTAFCLVFLPDGSLFMANNVRRGVEIPGGHIDPGETMVEAARREVREETGAAIGEIRQLGFLRMISEGAVPADHPYPHPVGFQVFHAAMLAELTPYAANAECAAPIAVPASEALSEGGPLTPSQRAFYAAGYELLFGSTALALVQREVSPGRIEHLRRIEHAAQVVLGQAMRQEGIRNASGFACPSMRKLFEAVEDAAESRAAPRNGRRA